MKKYISEVIYFPFEATIVVIPIVFLLFKYPFCKMCALKILWSQNIIQLIVLLPVKDSITIY